jgi:hypothetical protein
MSEDLSSDRVTIISLVTARPLGSERADRQAPVLGLFLPVQPAVPAPAAPDTSGVTRCGGTTLDQLIQDILVWPQAHEGDRDDDGGNGRGNDK